jgi:hypothetical protein
MKIIRYIDTRDQTGFAALQLDGSSLAIEGDLFGSFQVTDQPVKIAKQLAPIQPTAVFMRRKRSQPSRRTLSFS